MDECTDSCPVSSSNGSWHQPLPPPQLNNDVSIYTTQNSNFAYEYAQMVLNSSNTTLRLMPITSQNELAYIKMSIWATLSKELTELLMLYDIGAVLNTRYLSYHN